jgi:hypothetical protein
MHTSLRYLALVLVGIALAFVCTSVIGWLAAVAWDRETYRLIASSPLLSFLVLTLGMAALPVAILALVASAGLSRFVSLNSPLHLLLVSVPWAVTLLAPPAGVAGMATWFVQFFTEPHFLAVLAALPMGVLLGAVLSRTRANAGAA